MSKGYAKQLVIVSPQEGMMWPRETRWALFLWKEGGFANFGIGPDEEIVATFSQIVLNWPIHGNFENPELAVRENLHKIILSLFIIFAI